MKRKALSIALCAAMTAGSLAGCGMHAPETATTAAPAAAPAATETSAAADPASAANDPAITLVMAEVNPLDTIVGMTDSKFKEEVEKLSGGSITIDLQAAGVLGSENDVLDAMLGGGGGIDLSRISAFALTSYGGEKSSLLSIPYTFVSRDHFWNFAESDMAQEFLTESQQNGSGVRGLFYGEEGFRHFFTKTEVKTIDDLKGMKLRVSNDPIMNGMVKGLGASPTVVAFGELYSALQTGVVDGAEQPIANYKSNAFPEVAPNLILDGHTLGAIQVVITDEAWDKLTDNQKNAMMEAGKAAGAYNKKISAEKEEEVLKELKDEGVNVVEVADITPWQEACKEIITESSAKYPELYQKLLDLATAAPKAEAKADEKAAAPAAIAVEGNPVTLVMAEVNPLDTIVGMTDTKFKETVEAISGGNITIDLQAAGVLGSENDVLDAMLGGGGGIDLSRISAFALTSYGGEKSSLLSIPYTFVSRDHFWNFAESDLAQEFLTESQQNGSGVRGLFYGEEGFRHFFTKTEVKTIDDLKGMKLRVSNDPIMNGMVKGLGASPTVVAFGELYSALQTGVVDGAEQPIANYKSNAFPEVAPNLILDGHTLGAIQVVITDEAWDKLTESQQQCLVEAGKVAGAYNKQISAEKEAEVLKELKAEGVNVVEVTDITPWQEACSGIIKESSAKYPDLYQKLLDLQ